MQQLSTAHQLTLCSVNIHAIKRFWLLGSGEMLWKIRTWLLTAPDKQQLRQYTSN